VLQLQIFVATAHAPLSTETGVMSVNATAHMHV